MEQYVLIKLKEYAVLKNLSYSMVHSMVKRGRLPATKFGGTWRISPDAVPIKEEEKFPQVFKSNQDYCSRLDAINIF